MKFVFRRIQYWYNYVFTGILFTADTSLLTILFSGLDKSEKEPANQRETENANRYGDYRSSMLYDSEKPCVYISSGWPNARHRMYHSNLLSRLAFKLVRILIEYSVI
jgi:hypothetical protein